MPIITDELSIEPFNISPLKFAGKGSSELCRSHSILSSSNNSQSLSSINLCSLPFVRLFFIPSKYIFLFPPSGEISASALTSDSQRASMPAIHSSRDTDLFGVAASFIASIKSEFIEAFTCGHKIAAHKRQAAVVIVFLIFSLQFIIKQICRICFNIFL